MAEPLSWAHDGASWPHHAASAFISVGALRWHVQRLGPSGAPQVLLIHGTGSSCHSWRLLAPLLARRLQVWQFDLPGHAFTRTPATQPLTLPGIAQAVADLLVVLQVQPALIVGHSAGAAVGAQLVLSQGLQPLALVAINGALLPLHGVAGRVFSPLARLLAAQPLVPQIFAWHAGRESVLKRLLDSTGSTLDAEGARLYGRLVADAGHAAGALRMMAAWDLHPLAQALPQLPVPLHLLAGTDDQTLPHDHSRRVQQQVPGASLSLLPGLGHLAHEEDARRVRAAMAPALALLKVAQA